MYKFNKLKFKWSEHLYLNIDYYKNPPAPYYCVFWFVNQKQIKVCYASSYAGCAGVNININNKIKMEKFTLVS